MLFIFLNFVILVIAWNYYKISFFMIRNWQVVWQVKFFDCAFRSKNPLWNNTYLQISYFTVCMPAQVALICWKICFSFSPGRNIQTSKEKNMKINSGKTWHNFASIYPFQVFCSMMACTIHCRHLMVWKIFAPRFIYEGLATFISLHAIIFGYLILIRVHWSVSRMINRINKTK